MSKCYIDNLTEEKIDEEIKILKNLIKFAMKHENLKNVEFNIVFVDNKRIHEINREYRGIDRETDVISFALEDSKTIELPIRLLGDIYISLEKARGQAEEYGHSFLREICFLAIHGFYHLLGYDHLTEEDERVMFQKQEEVLELFGIRR